VKGAERAVIALLLPAPDVFCQTDGVFSAFFVGDEASILKGKGGEKCE
jgi:hypothetical protein